MRRRMVGVCSDDDGLFVDLALRREGLDVRRVDDVRDLGGHDVALVDVPHGQDAAAWAAAVPPGPAVVLLADDARAVEGATVVRVPCSLDALADVLQRAVAGRSGGVVITLDDAVTTATERPAAPAAAVAGAGPSDVGPITNVAAAPAPVGAATGRDEATATAWHRRLLAALPPLTSVPALAKDVAAAVADEVDADHVALWEADGDGYRPLGAVGLSAGARRMRLAPTHPVVQLARAHDGILHRGVDDVGARAPGLPGSASATYTMVLLDDGPIAAITLSGRDLRASDAEQVRQLGLELADRWPTVP